MRFLQNDAGMTTAQTGSGILKDVGHTGLTLLAHFVFTIPHEHVQPFSSNFMVLAQRHGHIYQSIQ